MPQEGGGTRLDVVTQIVSVAAAVLGAAGYVLALGAAVLWLRLHDAKLPTEVPLALASREELIVMGAQALALWLLLATVAAVLAIRWIDRSETDRWVEVLSFLVGVTLAAAVAYAGDADLGWWFPIAVAALATIVFTAGLVLYRPATDLLESLLPVAVGVALVWGVFQLADENRGKTLAFAGLTIAAVLRAVPALHELRLRRAANAAALLRLEALQRAPPPAGQPPEAQGTVNTLIASLRERPGGTASTGAGGGRGALRWIAAGVVALLALGTLAVASQLDRKHDFRHIVVTLMSGRCLTGTYLTRGPASLVLADLGPRRAVVIPLKAVRTSQLNGARGTVQDLETTECAERDRILPQPAPRAPPATTPTTPTATPTVPAQTTPVVSDPGPALTDPAPVGASRRASATGR